MATRILLFLLFASSCTTVCADSLTNLFPYKNTLYKTTEVEFQNPMKINYKLSAQCVAEIFKLISGNKKTLEKDAIMALDAFGKPPAGVLEMNLAWLGHYDECMAIDGFNYCLVNMMLNVTRLADSPLLRDFLLKYMQKTHISVLHMKWGVCVPQSCGNNDVNAVIMLLMDAANILDGIIPSGALKEVGSFCAKKPPIPYNTGFILTVILCCFIASLMLLGALYDEYLQLQKKTAQSRTSLFAVIASPWRLLDESEADSNNEKVPLIRNVGNKLSTNGESDPPKKQSLTAKLLLCFALTRNLTKLMDVRQSDNSVGSLNGIRVISMSWVILGHTLVFAYLSSTTDNTLSLLQWISTQPSFQAVANAFFSVDSFFFLRSSSPSIPGPRSSAGLKFATSTPAHLSGVAPSPMIGVSPIESQQHGGEMAHSTDRRNGGAYSTMCVENMNGRWVGLLEKPREDYLTPGEAPHSALTSITIDKRFLNNMEYYVNFRGFLIAYLSFGRFKEFKNIKTWALFYFHRFWRITPLYAFTILVYMYIPQFFGDGPLWQSTVARRSCTKYWWTNLLYISNFWPVKFGEQCIGWSWYLANDMQFFIISPFLMAPLFYFPILGWLGLFGTLLASFVTTGVIISHFNLSVSLAGLFQQTNGADFSSLVYGKPYCRIAPYLVGIGLGYIMHRIGKRKVKMSPILALIGWLTAGSLATTVLYSLYPSLKSPMSEAGNIAYGTLSRFVWALALAWVVFACKYGYGGWINSFLSWRAWIPLARVTYSAYMFHPIVIFVFYNNFSNPWHFSPYLLAFYFAALVSMSYFLAVFVALAIEYPFANLEKIFLPTRTQPKKTEECPPICTNTATGDVVTVITPSEEGVVFRGSAHVNGIPRSNEGV